MDRTSEEILEAVWKADERGRSSLSEIRENCAVEFAETDLELLTRRKLIDRTDDRITMTAIGKKEAEGVVRRHRSTNRDHPKCTPAPLGPSAR